MDQSKRRRFWGWGYEDAGPDEGVLSAALSGLSYFLGAPPGEPRARPTLDRVALRKPRIELPEALRSIATDDPFERALHTYGRSYRDLVRTTRMDFSNPPDFVATPATEEEVVRVLEHCDAARLSVIPFGGGSSVSGGVEADPEGAHEGVITLDLRRLDRVLEIDRVSRAARIQAGVFGPSLEEQLRPSGLTLRHYPQSFEFSTLGGWIVTRAGGHYATLYTHIDDFVESLRVVAPAGVVETRRLPGSGAGPSPERLFLGSEGTLGVVTEAWMRLQDRPRHRAGFSTKLPSFSRGLEALRALCQAALFPSNCRLLDPREALMNGAGDGERATLIVAFESADHPLDAWVRRAAEICRDHGAEISDDELAPRAAERGPGGAAEIWRKSFLRAPYLRDELVLRGIFVETFETAATWDRLPALHDAVLAAADRAGRETGGSALVSCRITHAYPDGAAPYYTVIAPAANGEELAQWTTIKDAITGAILAHGGTTTHHHAVGRDFKPYYERERSPAFAGALVAAKASLDPNGILNPGVLL